MELDNSNDNKIYDLIKKLFSIFKNIIVNSIRDLNMDIFRII